MKHIGIDLGDKRVGIASENVGVAFPRDVIPRIELIPYLKKLLSENDAIENIIVGLPYDLYGTDTKQLDKTQKFIEKLKNIFPEKTIIGHDERFSSFEADHGTGEHRDDIAAQCILQSYLDSKK